MLPFEPYSQAFAFRLNGQSKEGVAAALQALAAQRKTPEGVKAMSVSLLSHCLRSCHNFQLAFVVISTMRQPPINPNGDQVSTAMQALFSYRFM
jgi:hypothetical protein